MGRGVSSDVLKSKDIIIQTDFVYVYNVVYICVVISSPYKTAMAHAVQLFPKLHSIHVITYTNICPNIIIILHS